mmetsp:Transcript_21467/g.33704  ORF Transcript_21467/g.33704 Transcript_21467/m.33704 type:complete len:464 (+) Transcript_21467:205-1596(+)
MCVRNDSRRRTTSSSKTEKDRRQRSCSRPHSSSRSRSEQRMPSTAESVEDKHRSRSRSASSRGRPRSSTRTPKREYDTPFDSKGRCHHHPDLQLARKKLTGGWKVIQSRCPKCTGDECVTNSTRSHGDRSKSPRRGGGDYKSSSRSVCDNRSVSSRHSNTTRSTRSSRSVSPGRRKTLPLGSNNRKEERCPFDDKGYCHRHSNVRLAKKKFTGGWKILLDRCHECVADEKDSKSVRSSRSSRRSRSKSVCSRSSRHSRSKSVCSKGSRHDGRHYSHQLSDATIVVEDVSASTSNNHKKKSVKKMTYSPCVYKDKSVYRGTSMEGNRTHGKFIENAKRDKNHRSRKDAPKNSQVRVPEGEFEDSADFERQWENERRKAKNTVQVEQGKDRHESMTEYVYLSNTSAKAVRDLSFVDLGGDAGKYTGEVNDKLLPHGQGCLTYNHGFVQEGNWTNGFIDDDCSIVC